MRTKWSVNYLERHKDARLPIGLCESLRHHGNATIPLKNFLYLFISPSLFTNLSASIKKKPITLPCHYFHPARAGAQLTIELIKRQANRLLSSPPRLTPTGSGESHHKAIAMAEMIQKPKSLRTKASEQKPQNKVQ